MAYFWNKGRQIFFSLCKDGEWIRADKGIEFEYQEDIISIWKNQVDEDTWDMLLQVLNLNAT